MHCVKGLKERVRIAQIEEGENPLLFLAQVNFAEAKDAFLAGDDSRPWPFPAAGLMYFFIGSSGHGWFDQQKVLFYGGPVDKYHLAPTHPSVICCIKQDVEGHKVKTVPEGYTGEVRERTNCFYLPGALRSFGAKRYVFSRGYTLLSDSQDEECIHESFGAALTESNLRASGSFAHGGGDSNVYMVSPNQSKDRVVLLRDNCGFQHGDCQSLFVTMSIQDLLKRNFEAVSGMPDRFDSSQVEFET